MSVSLQGSEPRVCGCVCVLCAQPGPLHVIGSVDPWVGGRCEMWSVCRIGELIGETLAGVQSPRGNQG